MYLFLKPLVITKIYQERVNNYGVSNEYIKMNVITGGQNFFINETGLFTNGNRKFDEEWKNNEKLESYSGELVIYNRDKIKPEDLIEQQVKLESKERTTPDYAPTFVIGAKDYNLRKNPTKISTTYQSVSV